MFLNISQKLNVLVHYVKGNAGLLPECSVDNCSGDSSTLTPMAPYFLFVTAPMDRPSTADYLQTIQIIHTELDSIVSSKGRA